MQTTLDQQIHVMYVLHEILIPAPILIQNLIGFVKNTLTTVQPPPTTSQTINVCPLNRVIVSKSHLSRIYKTQLDRFEGTG